MKQSNISPMQPCHVAQVAALEKACFSDPWPESVLVQELENPLSLWLVAAEEDTVLGYVGAQSVIDEADMMNLAVKEDARRQGLAEQLVCELCTRLAANGIKHLLLEVRVSNAPALALYEKLGFAQIGRRPNYYFHPKEDALILRKEL